MHSVIAPVCRPRVQYYSDLYNKQQHNDVARRLIRQQSTTRQQPRLSHGNIIRVTYTASGGLARNRILYNDSIRICYHRSIVVIRVFGLLYCTGVLPI